MKALARKLCKAHRHSSERGVVILQAIAVMVVSAIITSTVVIVVLMEIGNMQQDAIRDSSADIANAGMGWAAAWGVDANLPLKDAESTSMTWTAPDATNSSQTDCYKLYLNTSTEKLLARIAPYGGSGDCTSELSSATDQTIASGITNFGASQPVFTYYSGTSALSSPASPAASALSFDISLHVQPTATAATVYGASYHVIFGGAVTTNLMSASAVTSASFADNTLGSAEFASSSLSPSDFSSGALETFDRIPIVSDSLVNSGGHLADQANVWRSSATSHSDTLPGGATFAGGPSTVSPIAVNYSDYCVSGKVLMARALYTVYNPGYPVSGAINVAARLLEYPGPTASITANNGSAAFLALAQSVPSGGTSQLVSPWITIDNGSCSATNRFLSASNPFYYTIETQSSVGNTDYSVVNAVLELEYQPVAANASAQAPDTPLLLSPGDGDFVGATPTLSARFTDPNTSDTGTLSFQICQDVSCNTVVAQGSSVAGLSNGSSGTWGVPLALSDGSTYYWRAQATDSTTLQSSWSATQSVKVSISSPALTITSLAPQSSAGFQYVNGNTLYFNPSLATTGSFNINVVGNGGGWGIDYIEFPTLGSSWTGGSGSVSSPSNGSTITRTYSWSSGATSATPVTVVMVTSAGLEKQAEFEVVADSAAPTGAGLSYLNGYSSAATADLTVSLASDNGGSGMPNGGVIQVRSATFSAGACGGFGTWGPLTTIPSGSGIIHYTDSTVSAGHCYQYQYIATDQVGNQVTVTPGSTLMVGAAPANTVVPTITGTLKDQSTNVTVGNGTWTGTSTIGYTYQWQECTTTSVSSCSDVAGQTSSVYQRLQSTDIGKYLRAQVTATNNFGQASVYTAETAVITALAPANTVLPVISGSYQNGATLSVSGGTWTGTLPFTLTYQWQSCTTAVGGCSNIAGAVLNTYQLQSTDVGKWVRVAVKNTNAGGNTTANTAIGGAVTS